MIAELSDRLTRELERLAAELSGARPDGSDLTELKRRARQLGQWVAALPEVEPGSIAVDRAGFGSEARLVDLDTGETVTYTLSAGEFIDIDAGEVSLESPIGHALSGRRVGDEIEVRVPRGTRRFRIEALTTLPARLGITDESGESRRADGRGTRKAGAVTRATPG